MSPQFLGIGLHGCRLCLPKGEGRVRVSTATVVYVEKPLTSFLSPSPRGEAGGFMYHLINLDRCFL